jgi:transposase
MKEIKVMGIDLAKTIFQVHGIDEFGKAVIRKQIRRKDLVEFMAQTKPCLVGMESCGGSNHWARVFKELGHEVKLMAPQYVKAYRKSDKNDRNDAEAICEAVTRANMRFVAVKSIAQQDIQSLHRVRTRYIRNRTALVNQIRGLLMEMGIVIPRSVSHLKKQIPLLLEGTVITETMRSLLRSVQEELSDWDSRILEMDQKLKVYFKSNEVCQRIGDVEGVGVVTATAIVATIGDAQTFKNGREFAAFLGLVPRQNSTGGKTKLSGINKRGDKYIRTLLIHGARAALRYVEKKPDAKSRWAKKLIETRGFNIASVALANKNARQIWAIMAKNTSYKLAA